jgi:hypothetical protein
VDVLAGDGEVDGPPGDARHGHADDEAAAVNHRPARVARVHAAVDLDPLQGAVVLAQRRDRRRPDGDLLAQPLAEREAEHVDVVQLLEEAGRRDDQRLGQVRGRAHVEDGEVGAAVDAEHPRG